MLRMIVIVMVTIHQGAHFCNGCSTPVPDIDIGIDAVQGFDIVIDTGDIVHVDSIGGVDSIPQGRAIGGGVRGVNSELMNVSTCRMEDFEGFKELCHRVDSFQANDDQSMNKIVDHEMKRSGIQSNKNMCHPEGEKFECYNDYSKNHCICHLEQPLDHDNYNTTITEPGEENNWKQPFITRYLTATICNSFYGGLFL